MKALSFRGFCLAASVICLAGCGVFGGEKKEDAKAEAGKAAAPLEVPPDLITPTIDPRYAFDDSPSTTFSSFAKGEKGEKKELKPVSENVLPGLADKVRMDRSGSQRWLVVPGTPDTVWVELRKFWKEAGYTLRQDAPELGIMETDWLKKRVKEPEGAVQTFLSDKLGFLTSTGELEKFRTRVEKSSEDGLVEVYISYRGATELIVDDATRWAAAPVDADREAQMLRRFAMRFGVEDKRAAQIVADGNAKDVSAKLGLAARAELVDKDMALEVQGSLDLVWRRVGLALDRKGVVIEGQDNSAKVYYVRYFAGPEDVKAEEQAAKPAKSAPEPEDNTKPKHNGPPTYDDLKGVSVNLASVENFFSSIGSFWNKRDNKTSQFGVRLESKGENRVKVTVLNKLGKPASAESSQEILKVLLEELK